MNDELAMTAPSNSMVNRCGQALMQYWHADPLSVPMPAIPEVDAIVVLNAFRREHASPMLKVRMGLISFAKTERVDAVVTQRLKRRAQIVRKLVRMRNTRLAALEDIGGCRIVFTGPAPLHVVLTHLRHTWAPDIKRERDYVDAPNATGYRAHHVIVERDGRRIEIQLRTRGQQQWADAIEAADSRLGTALKDGQGPDAMMRYFALSSEVIHANEYGLRIGMSLTTRFRSARDEVIAAGYYQQ